MKYPFIFNALVKLKKCLGRSKDCFHKKKVQILTWWKNSSDVSYQQRTDWPPPGSYTHRTIWHLSLLWKTGNSWVVLIRQRIIMDVALHSSFLSLKKKIANLKRYKKLMYLHNPHSNFLKVSKYSKIDNIK